MKQVTAKVTDNSEILPKFTRPDGRVISSVHLIRLSCPEIAQEAKPGQFVMVRCGGECILPRPFSIHQINNAGIALFYAVWEGGKGTVWLSQCQEGDTLELFGPLGNGFSIRHTSHNLLLVSGGIGIAPLYFLAKEALSKGCSVTLLSGTPTAHHRYPESRLPRQIELVIATEDGKAGHKGMVTDLIPNFIDWADQVFACGPLGMYRDMYVQREKLLKGKPAQISLEVRMGCGLGVCYGCTVKTRNGLKQVCKDGPVFDLEDILWDELSL